MGASSLLMTTSHPWRKLKATNFTDTSFADKKSVATRPTGDGVLDAFSPKGPPEPHGIAVQNWLLLRFFGAGASDQTFSARVWGWRPSLSAAGALVGYDPMLLAEFALTLSAAAGVAGQNILSTDLEVDTITLTHGASADVQIVSPALDIRGAWAAVDMRGCLFPEIQFDMTGATSGNVLWAKG